MIPDRPYNEWMEEAVALLYENEVVSIGLVALLADGTVYTAYYNTDVTDKALMVHNIQSDIQMEILENNIDFLKELLETDGEEK